jgi:hypothetical protein
MKPLGRLSKPRKLPKLTGKRSRPPELIPDKPQAKRHHIVTMGVDILREDLDTIVVKSRITGEISRWSRQPRSDWWVEEETF